MSNYFFVKFNKSIWVLILKSFNLRSPKSKFGLEYWKSEKIKSQIFDSKWIKLFRKYLRQQLIRYTIKFINKLIIKQRLNVFWEKWC
jgi:hypothetical protein